MANRDSTAHARFTMDPTDPESFNHCFAAVADGKRMHYVDQGSESAHVVLFLVHGFPDIWAGWRKVIPGLVARGYRVVVPTMRGCGLSDTAHASRNDVKALSQYSIRAHCLDLALLAQQLVPVSTRKYHKLVWIGHDWGSFIVFRMPLHHPQLVDAAGSLCVPYSPPHTHFYPTRDLEKMLPHFAYQVVFDEQNVEPAMDANVERALTLFFQGHTGHLDLSILTKAFLPGIDGAATHPPLESLVSGCVLRTDAKVWDYYVRMFKRTGFHGGICGYRVRKINFDDELPLVKADASCRVIKVPFLLVTVGRDPCFPPTMGAHQGQFLPKLTVKHVELAGHWVNQEQPEQVVDHIWSWLQSVNATEWGGAIYKVKL
ncbi:hypothetical protein GGF32_009886 [Allomyces javanicus]|nr:hypothetical protein GGF32_009886 [Allomyces javanicus]